MKSDIVHVSTNGDGIAEALKLAERVSAYSSLEKKDAIHLRLFAEEMMGMMRALTVEREADFWIESEDAEGAVTREPFTAAGKIRREFAADTLSTNPPTKE